MGITRLDYRGGVSDLFDIVQIEMPPSSSKYRWLDQVCTDPWGFHYYHSKVRFEEVIKFSCIVSIKETIRFPQHCENSCSIHCCQNSRYNLVIICVCGAPGSACTYFIHYNSNVILCLLGVNASHHQQPVVSDQKLELITRTG